MNLLIERVYNNQNDNQFNRNACAKHDNRDTIMPKDMQIAARLQKNSVATE